MFINSNDYLNAYYRIECSSKILIFKRGGYISIRESKVNHVSDVDIIDELVIQDVYKISQTVSHNFKILDVGAHIGTFSILSSIMFEEIEITALEPEPGNFHLLKKNLVLNGLSTIKKYPLALGKKSGGKANFFLDDNNTGGGSLFQDITSDTAVKNEKKAISCELISLSDLLRICNYSSIDLLKLDCEGAERLIVDEPVDVLRCVDSLLIEIHDNEASTWQRQICLFLTSCSFKTFKFDTLRTTEGMYSIYYYKKNNTAK